MLPANVCPAMDSGIHENYIHRLFEELDLLRKFSSDTHMAACDALAVSLASIYFELFLADPKTERHKDSSFARDILIYINENYASQITLKKLAEQFHISTDHISHEFSKVYGISPINYVIDRRLNEAKWMLINTSDSLVSIAKKSATRTPIIFQNSSRRECSIRRSNSGNCISTKRAPHLEMLFSKLLYLILNIQNFFHMF